MFPKIYCVLVLFCNRMLQSIKIHTYTQDKIDLSGSNDVFSGDDDGSGSHGDPVFGGTVR